MQHVHVKQYYVSGIMYISHTHTKTERERRNDYTHKWTHTHPGCALFPQIPALLPIGGQPFIQSMHITQFIDLFFQLNPIRLLWNQADPLRHNSLRPSNATPTLGLSVSLTNGSWNPHCLRTTQANRIGGGRNHRGPGIQVWLQR